MIDQDQQWLARLQADVSRLAERFNDHAQKPVHEGFTDVLEDIQRCLRTLESRWLQVGGAVIGLLLTILIALLGVLWNMAHAGTLPIPPVQP